MQPDPLPDTAAETEPDAIDRGVAPTMLALTQVAEREAEVARVANVLLNARLAGRAAPGFTEALSPYSFELYGGIAVAKTLAVAAAADGRRPIGPVAMRSANDDGVLAGVLYDDHLAGTGAVMLTNELIRPRATLAWLIVGGPGGLHLRDIGMFAASGATVIPAIALCNRADGSDEPEDIGLVADNLGLVRIAVSFRDVAAKDIPLTAEISANGGTVSAAQGIDLDAMFMAYPEACDILASTDAAFDRALVIDATHWVDVGELDSVSLTLDGQEACRIRLIGRRYEEGFEPMTSTTGVEA